MSLILKSWRDLDVKTSLAINFPQRRTRACHSDLFNGVNHCNFSFKDMSQLLIDLFEFKRFSKKGSHCLFGNCLFVGPYLNRVSHTRWIFTKSLELNNIVQISYSAARCKFTYRVKFYPHKIRWGYNKLHKLPYWV